MKDQHAASLAIAAVSLVIAEWVVDQPWAPSFLQQHGGPGQLILQITLIALVGTASQLLSKSPITIGLWRGTTDLAKRAWKAFYENAAPWYGAAYIRPWRAATMRLIRKHRRTEIRDIANAFITTYAKEEAKHLDGDAGRGENGHTKHEIYTSFPSYAALVESVVTAFQAKVDGTEHGLVCCTTLVMELPQWFNYHIDHSRLIKTEAKPATYRPDVKSASAASWDRYIRYMHELVHPKSASHGRDHHSIPLDVYRVILVRSKEWDGIRGAPFVLASDMRAYLNLDLLAQFRDGEFDDDEMPQQMPQSHGPLDGGNLPRLPNENSLYKENCLPAYAIVPSEIAAQSEPPEGFGWQKLGLAFNALFHRVQDGKRCFVAELGNNDPVSAVYRKANEMPHDFFLVGTRPKETVDPIHAIETIDWKFGLAAHVCRGADAVAVEFVSTELNPERLRQIGVYAKRLLVFGEKEVEHVHEISRWLNDRASTDR